MKKRFLLGLTSALVLSAAVAPLAEAACTPVSTSRGNFTAAVVDSNVTGEVDATGCDIGVYYSDNSGSWSVSNADVHGALWYGVFNDGANVSVTDSDIHDIGDDPKNGVQRGIAVIFGSSTTDATGLVDDSDLYDYQKGGVVISGENSSASVTDSTVTGLGKVEFIAQNGIQFSPGSDPVDVSGNTVKGHHYTGPSKPTVATGILLWEADVTGREVGQISSSNEVNHNQANITYIKQK